MKKRKHRQKRLPAVDQLIIRLAVQHEYNLVAAAQFYPAGRHLIDKFIEAMRRDVGKHYGVVKGKKA